ncbi:hypothetical protein C7974DRAFT_380503 [Boeremia exigua]|uniref:uncharacterized protein n=1 Tax=Boeremia exigua TaxID=749465 RepID=UPI001E8D1853|nr:uncharacterized protein C7974DRAFT_380503 [Boeremia exigua]KAH6614135.1 hypothetical protein C7974DRAFT_380503 [Boeremia exigua]
MSFPAGSREDVEAWARSEFPAYFEATLMAGGVGSYGTSYFGGEYVDGKVVLQPILVAALKVGLTTTGQTVYARLRGDDDVQLFSDHKLTPPMEDSKPKRLLSNDQKLTSSTEDNKSIRCIIPVMDLADVQLHSPFYHSLETGHPAGVDRLETLIRFQCLIHGDMTAVQPKLGFFKTHFRAACRDVARGTGAVVEEDNLDDLLPGDTPPELIADTDIGRLRDNPTATHVFRSHIHALDESYHDFKISALRHLGAIQAVEKTDAEELRARNKELERSVVLAEESRVKLEKELAVEREKTKAATGEAVGWKAQYEGLMDTLQSVVGRPC